MYRTSAELPIGQSRQLPLSPAAFKILLRLTKEVLVKLSSLIMFGISITSLLKPKRSSVKSESHYCFKCGWICILFLHLNAVIDK